MTITDSIMDRRVGKPKAKVTHSDPFAAHVMQTNMICGRCGKAGWDIEANKQPCITDARARGNAAIHRITR